MAKLITSTGEHDSSLFDRLSVATLKERFGEQLGIDPRAKAFMDGDELPEDHIIDSDDEVEFIRQAGKKG